jgi:hypothetical protein
LQDGVEVGADEGGSGELILKNFSAILHFLIDQDMQEHECRNPFQQVPDFNSKGSAGVARLEAWAEILLHPRRR